MLFRNISVYTLVALIVVGSYAIGQQNSAQTRNNVDSLLLQRETLLNEILEYTKTKYKQGVASLDELVAAEHEVISARLETATSVDDRIKLRELQVQMAMEKEREIERLVKSGVNSTQDLRLAKVKRLNAEIALSKEEANK